MTTTIFEGAKVTSQLVQAAMADPEFTLGFEAEFYLPGAREVIQKLLGKNQREQHGWYGKRVDDLTWYDVLKYFIPLDVDTTTKDNQELMNARLQEAHQEYTGSEEHTLAPKMFNDLLDHLHPRQILAALKIFPERGFFIPESQSNAIFSVMHRGDVERAGELTKLDDTEFRTFLVDQDSDEYALSSGGDAHINREIFYATLAKEMSDVLGEPVAYASFPGDAQHASSNYTKWVVTYDASLANGEGAGDFIGIELISPVKQMSDGYTSMLKVFEIMNSMGAITTEDTGFHINMGIRGKDIDYVKLLLLMGDSYIAQKFSRDFNDEAVQTYQKMVLNLQAALPRMNQLIDEFRNSADREIIERVKRVIALKVPRHKTYSVNLTKLEQGFIEFRSPGNKDYHKRAEDIDQVIKRLAVMIHVATDPEIYHKEFLTKLYKLITIIGQQSKQPMAASVGMIGKGPRGGYGVPEEDTEKTPYDGENFIQYGFDPGSETA